MGNEANADALCPGVNTALQLRDDIQGPNQNTHLAAAKTGELGGLSGSMRSASLPRGIPSRAASEGQAAESLRAADWGLAGISEEHAAQLLPPHEAQASLKSLKYANWP